MKTPQAASPEAEPPLENLQTVGVESDRSFTDLGVVFASDETPSEDLELRPAPAPPVSSPWARPATLIDRLRALSADAVYGRWARDVLEEIDALGRLESLSAAEAARLLVRLDRLVRDAESLAAELPSNRRQSELLRAKFALARRLSIWRPVYRIAAANPTTDYTELLSSVEAYEQTGTTTDARRLARFWRALGTSSSPAVKALADSIEGKYRNANIRLAVSGTLLNRLVPEVDPVEEDVNDRILGRPVRGRSLTSTRLWVRLFPDSRRWRVGLDADGSVSSRTSSSQGPITFFSDGVSEFRARKFLLIDALGIRAPKAQAEADARTDLTDVKTDFDIVPLVGAVVRDIARSQHDAQRHKVVREIERKVATRAQRRLDAEVQTRLVKANERFQQAVVAPLTRLDLDPVAIDFQTTRQRLIGRYRLAGAGQMAAYTPRPRAPAGSCLSCQIHQSAINNLLEQLKLDGRRCELRSLYGEIAEVFGRPDIEVPDDVPDGVLVTFAGAEAIRVRCERGRAVLSINLAELKSGRSRWRDVAVRAEYRPACDGLRAELVRDGPLSLHGKRLHLRDQIALRAVFNKVLSRKNSLPLVQQRFVDDPRLEGLEVTQCNIEDGWIGLAIGPQRTGRQRVATGEEERRR